MALYWYGGELLFYLNSNTTKILISNWMDEHAFFSMLFCDASHSLFIANFWLLICAG